MNRRLSRPAPAHAPNRTGADYLALAVGPVLIILMVGSLVFFLVEVGYRGSFTPQVYWILFWFTIASVLVSRISIEHGKSYGSLYGVALAAATALRLASFVDTPLGAFLLLGLIWWCAGKLTWDCTVIDDATDASGEGLMSRAGLAGEAAEPGEPPAPPPDRPAPPTPAEETTRHPHAPGLWVIYFSLGVLPVFGFGQWLIPASEADARARGFVLAAIYVTAALALLLTTSFLGLRRYLRQRYLVMPRAVAGSWMALGALMLGGVLLAALLLPRPHGPDTLAHLGLGIRSRPQQASAQAWMRGDEAARGEGRRLGKRRADDPETPGSKTDGSSGEGPGGEGDTGPGGSGRDGQRAGRSRDDGDTETRTGGEAPAEGGDSGPSEDGSEARREGSGQASASGGSPELPPLSADPLALLRWVSYALGLAVVVYLLVRFGRQWWEALRRALASARKSRQPEIAAKAPRRPALADFRDPFVSGRADSMTPEQLTAYTFEALEAWAADSGKGRPPEQTPIEFGEALARFAPESADEVRGAIRLYVRAAYGGRTPTPESLAILRRLWTSILPS
jgi:hypothetical protein